MKPAEWKSLALLGVGVYGVAYFSVKAAMAIVVTIGIIAFISHSGTVAKFIGSVES